MPIELEKHSRENPLIIAGPCAAESLEQLLQIGAEMKSLSIPAMRASLFKPRTEPGDEAHRFDGVGFEKGGDWLAEVARQHDLAVATEVTNGNDVDIFVNKVAAAKSSSQVIVWLGSRMQLHTLQQDVGRALKDSPETTLLLIKNQPWGDQRHWEGILQHVALGAQMSEEQLKKRVAMVHRGFAPYGLQNPENWRNVPDFDMAMRVKRHTGLKMILDPSHIGGSPRNVFKAVQQAVLDPSVNFDGFMIEVHPDPKLALTDARQQLTVSEFRDLMEEIDNARN